MMHKTEEQNFAQMMSHQNYFFKIILFLQYPLFYIVEDIDGS